MKKTQKPLGVTVVGMDERSEHTLQLFFQGACKSGCEIVESRIADISIVDMDAVNAESLYKQHREKFPKQVFILLSLTDREEAGTFFVKKPIELKALMMVLERIRKEVNGAGVDVTCSSESVSTSNEVETVSSELPLASSQESRGKRASSSNSTHRSAMSLDEKSFISFIGALKNIDLNSKEQIDNAHYDPKAYLQGYFQSACKVALNKQQVLKLDGSWKSLVLFPKTNEVWLDANDKQLQAACRMPLRALADAGPNDAKGSGMSMSLVSDVSKIDSGNENNFQNMDSFLWKVSLWTSQGRVPLGVDLGCPVYLRHWPNMTRLMLFPHAMRIAALMMSEPRSLLDIAQLLGIPPQYVFAFYSAARALGLAGQVERQADTIVAPQPFHKPKQRGLFGKILDRLKIG